MSELKPCPFCGCDDARVQVEHYAKWARDVMEPAEIPAPKMHLDKDTTRMLIEQNGERIIRWHAEGKSRWWMAQTIGLPVNNSNSIARWLAKQGAL